MKKGYYLIIALLTCFSLNLSGQGWEITVGADNNSSSWTRFIAPTSDGHYVSNGSNAEDIFGDYIHKFDQFGNTIWLETFEMNPTGPNGLIETTDQNYLMSSGFISAISTPYNRINYKKIDPSGTLLWEYNIEDSFDGDVFLQEILPIEDGGFVVKSQKMNFTSGNPPVNYLTKYDADGLTIWDNLLPFNGVLNRISDNGGYIFTGNDSVNVYRWELDSFGAIDNMITIPWTAESSQVLSVGEEVIIISREIIGTDSSIIRQVKYDDQSNLISTDTIWNGPIICFWTVKPVEDGLLFSGSTGDFPSPHNNIGEGLLMKTTLDGTIVFSKIQEYRKGNSRLTYAIPSSHDDGYLACGSAKFQTSKVNDLVIKTTADGCVYTNFVTGDLAIDSQENCEIDPGEFRIKEWIVTATNDYNGDVFSGSSDEMGNYLVPLDTGNYTMSIYPINDLWMPCVNDVPISYPDFNNTDTLDFPIQGDIECPGLFVSTLISDRIRRCVKRTVRINYCNNGPTVVDDVRLEVTLDPLIVPDSSSVPWDNLNGNIVIWNIGTLQPLECGDIALDVTLDCDAELGLSYCIESHLYPDTICGPTSPQWSGAFLELQGICDNDSIFFQIKNIGTEAMDEKSSYFIVEDAILMFMDSVDILAPDQSISIPLEGNGSTFSLLAEQVSDAPIQSDPIVIVEGCGVNSNGTFSINFGNQFPLDDGHPALEIDCPIAVASFDPNDKTASPFGYSDEHYIEPETPIEYTIRFQNTGTDTAFYVSIRDTLDSALDIGTFRKGASSHPYRFEVTGQNILIFTFPDIMLPDSNVNLVGSNGYVEFKISPKADTPLGTVIRNDAAIYFDYNPPIITNETFHTLGLNFIEIMVGTTEHPTIPNVNVIVRPNPFVDFAIFDLVNLPDQNFLMQLFDINGRLIRQENHNSSTFIFAKKELSSGMYFYRLSAEDGFVNTGKLMIH